MHHGRRRHHRGLGLRWYDRENVLERLESYQRDLEHCQQITLERWRRRPIWEKVAGPFVWILERQQ